VALFTSSLSAQFSGLSSTADGSSLDFASTLRLKNSSQPRNGKIFVATQDSVSLFRAREPAFLPADSPACTVGGFADYLGAETSSAGVVALSYLAIGAGRCSFPANAFTTQIVTASGETNLPGIVRLSTAGRYAIVYLGATGPTIERLQGLLAHGGVINVVLAGAQIGSTVRVDIGQVHYGAARWIGTIGDDPAASWLHVPESGQLRSGERVLIVGAAGPMGQMHMIRSVAADRPPAELVGTDIDDDRLAALRAKVEPFATERGVPVRYLNTRTEPITGEFTYQTVMVPSAALAAATVATAAAGCIIDIFAGIPAGSTVREMIERAITFEQQTLLFFYTLRDLVQPVNRALVDSIVSEERSHVRRLAAMRSAQ